MYNYCHIMKVTYSFILNYLRLFCRGKIVHKRDPKLKLAVYNCNNIEMLEGSSTVCFPIIKGGTVLSESETPSAL
jgi:hypothetical protein